MLLDPINSITSIEFYKKVAEQSLRRTFIYLAFLGLLFSIAFALMMKARLWPAMQETFDWLEKSVPTLTYSNGRITTPTNETITVRHPTLPQVAFIIDPLRQTPPTAQELSDAKVMAMLTGGAMHVLEAGGKLTTYDFSRSPNPKTVIIDSKFYREIARGLRLVLFPLGMAACFLVFLVWKLVAALFYSLIALMINGLMEAGLEYRKLFNISVYAQTFVVAVQAILLVVPASVPLLRPLALVATSVYIWLAVRRNAQAAPLPA